MYIYLDMKSSRVPVYDLSINRPLQDTGNASQRLLVTMTMGLYSTYVVHLPMH